MQLLEFNGLYKKIVITKEQKAEAEAKMEKMKQASKKLIKGTFSFHGSPGCSLKFGYKLFPGYPIFLITITDGEVCEVPLDIMRHINNTVKKVQRFKEEVVKNRKSSLLIPGGYTTEARISFMPYSHEAEELNKFYAA